MNNEFDIFVDSAANLTDEMVEETGIKVIPFTYTVNGTIKSCYEHDKPFKETAKAYYKLLSEGADIKTSLVCEEDFIKAISPSMEQGKDVLLVTITQGLSGTYAQAVKAMNALKEKFPERKMFVLDSVNASLGEGLLAVQAAKMKSAGESLDACAAWIEENRYRMNSVVTVNDLKYLKRSGRVSTIVAIAGALLNIKPMLHADGSSPAMLTVYAKERGRKKSIDAMIKNFTDNVIDPANQTIAITHCDCEEEANALADKLRQLGANDIVIEFYDLCTGSHVGPGTLALFYMGKERRSAATVAEHKKFGLFAKKNA